MMSGVPTVKVPPEGTSEDHRNGKTKAKTVAPASGVRPWSPAAAREAMRAELPFLGEVAAADAIRQMVQPSSETKAFDGPEKWLYAYIMLGIGSPRADEAKEFLLYCKSAAELVQT